MLVNLKVMRVKIALPVFRRVEIWQTAMLSAEEDCGIPLKVTNLVGKKKGIKKEIKKEWNSQHLSASVQWIYSNVFIPVLVQWLWKHNENVFLRGPWLRVRFSLINWVFLYSTLFCILKEIHLFCYKMFPNQNAKHLKYLILPFFKNSNVVFYS